MKLDILCTPRLSNGERAALEKIAEKYNTTVENLVRKAVRIFAAQCVPTHKNAK